MRMRWSANIAWILLVVVVAALFIDSQPEPPNETDPLIYHSPWDDTLAAPPPLGPHPITRTAWLLEGGVTGHPTPGLNIDPNYVFDLHEPVEFVKDQLNWDLVQTSDGNRVWVQSRYLTFVRPSLKVWPAHLKVPGRTQPSVFSAPEFENPITVVKQGPADDLRPKVAGIVKSAGGR